MPVKSVIAQEGKKNNIDLNFKNLDVHKILQICPLRYLVVCYNKVKLYLFNFYLGANVLVRSY